MFISGDISKEETITKIFEAVETLVKEKKLNLRAIVHSAGTGKPGKHQKLADGSMFHQENQNSIDFEDYDFYQSVYPKVIWVAKLDIKNEFSCLLHGLCYFDCGGDRVIPKP